MRRRQLEVSRAVRLAAQRHHDLGLLPGGMRMIERAMLLRHFPVGARLRELVAIITALLPDALQRLGGRMLAQAIPEQVMHQQQGPAAHIELAPESPDNVHVHTTLKRSRSITAATNPSILPVGSALPTGIYSVSEANPFKFPRLYRNNQYLSASFVRKQRKPFLNLVNFGSNRVETIIEVAHQCNSLGPYWEKYIQPILGADGKDLPVYQLKLDQFKLCDELLQSVAPGYYATGAMMQFFANGRTDMAFTLQRQEPLDHGLIVATSSDRAATWDKVVLRDENDGLPRLIYPAGTSDASRLETGLYSTNQHQKETVWPAEAQVYPSDSSSNFNAISTQATPAAFTPCQATETAVINDCNTTTGAEDHRATPGPSSAPTLGATDGPPPQDETAPNMTKTVEAGQDTPLDKPARTHDHATQPTDKGFASEEITDELEQAGHGTPLSPEPEQVDHETATSPEPEQATHDTPLSPELEQLTHEEGSEEDQAEGN